MNGIYILHYLCLRLLGLDRGPVDPLPMLNIPPVAGALNEFAASAGVANDPPVAPSLEKLIAGADGAPPKLKPPERYRSKILEKLSSRFGIFSCILDNQG